MWVDGQHSSGMMVNQRELRMLMKRTAVTTMFPLQIIWWRVWRLRSMINLPLFRRRPGSDGGWKMEGGGASPFSNLCSMISNAVPLTRRSATKGQGVCSG